MKLFSTLMTVLCLAACSLDKHYQDDVNFPAEARVINAGEWVEITRIVGNPEQGILYSLKGNRLSSGESYTLDITWEVAESLKSKAFSVQGKCRESGSWEKWADEIATSVVAAENDQGLILFTIDACP